tara:strand:- start:494 stop:1126 length:633 start_codon:yes stop_codon:yes gene_type:complete
MLLISFVFCFLLTGSVNGQTIEQWGQMHYQIYGNSESRIVPENNNYGAYVRSYPDLLVAYGKSNNSNSTVLNDGALSNWGKLHYEKYGKYEGRSLPSSENYRDYVLGYPDLWHAYKLAIGNAANNKESFQGCVYTSSQLKCSGHRGGFLSCILTDSINLSCKIDSSVSEQFDLCYLVGRSGVACNGNKGGSLRCNLVGANIVCNYTSIRR